MIYLDNAATTRPDQDAVRGALSLLNEEFYNPSALYKEGFSAHKRLEEARKSILSHVADVQKYSLVFTSCGSEADNQAIFSFARRGNFVTTEGEHAAVYQAAQELSRRGVVVIAMDAYSHGMSSNIYDPEGRSTQASSGASPAKNGCSSLYPIACRAVPP